MQKRKVLSLELKTVGDGKLIIISITVSGINDRMVPICILSNARFHAPMRVYPSNGVSSCTAVSARLPAVTSTHRTSRHARVAMDRISALRTGSLFHSRLKTFLFFVGTNSTDSPRTVYRYFSAYLFFSFCFSTF